MYINDEKNAECEKDEQLKLMQLPNAIELFEFNTYMITKWHTELFLSSHWIYSQYKNMLCCI